MNVVVTGVVVGAAVRVRHATAGAGDERHAAQQVDLRALKSDSMPAESFCGNGALVNKKISAMSADILGVDAAVRAFSRRGR